MSGRRRVPEPAIPVGGNDPLIAPPNPQVMASTDPTEVPPSPLPLEGEEQDRPIPQPAEEETPLSPEEEVMFASLLTCGRRSKTVHVLDHTVVVESLCAVDDLRIGLYAKEYAGSAGEQRAYQIAVAAAGLRSIDNVPVVNTLFQNADEDALFDQKVKKVEKMYPTVVKAIYKAVLGTEVEFMELVGRLGKSFG